MKPELIIIDRDGVINFDSEAYIKTPDEWIAIPGSLEAIAQLSKQGYKVHVATNQSGLARNYYTRETLDHIHEKMHQGVQELGGKIDFIAYCPHGPGDTCECRKPKPGLFFQCLAHAQIPASKTIAIGDSKRDLVAAKTAGCTPWLVLTGNGQKTRQECPEYILGESCFENLESAAKKLLTL